jgi:hypothetical protein
VASTTTVGTNDQAPAASQSVRGWLRLEGAAAFIAGVALYGWLGGPWLLVVPLLLLPDLSMVGYLRNPRAGALTYNAAHNWAAGLAVLGVGLAADAIAHVGMDRAVGYGLKSPSSFHDTHLGRIGR